MGTSRMQVSADDQDEPNDFNSDAREDEGNTRRAGGEHGHGGENKSPTSEQKDKPDKPQERAPGARGGPACAISHR